MMPETLDYDRMPPPPLSGWAVGSIVAGVVSILLLPIPLVPGLIGWLVGNAGLRDTDRPERRGDRLAKIGRRMSIVAMPLSIVVFAVTAVWLVRTARASVDAMYCRYNIQKIGWAVRAYAMEDAGDHFPPDLDAAFLHDEFNPVVLACPAGPEVPPQPGERILLGNNCSYVYLGAGLTDAAPAGAILAYELPGHHDRVGSGGGNVLYVGGLVEFVSPSVLKTIMTNHRNTPPGQPVLATPAPPPTTKPTTRGNVP